MSVPAYRRNESAVQYLDTARELEIYTLRYCAKFPKRFMFLITKHIVEISQEIYDLAKSANSIYPLTKSDEELRLTCLTKAICAVEELASQLEIAHELITHLETGIGQKSNTQPIKPKIWEDWAALMTSELRLLKSVRKSLHSKYKD